MSCGRRRQVPVRRSRSVGRFLTSRIASYKFVAVELPERDFEKVKIGSNADVRLVGSDKWMTGRVQNIRGSAANADHRLFAAQVRLPTPGTITVSSAAG